MSTEFEFDVFLSHDSEDKSKVELIARRLKDEFGLEADRNPIGES